MTTAQAQERAETIYAIDLAHQDWENALHSFLRCCGWQSTSQHPDAVWRWTKTFPPPYGRMTCEAMESFRIECQAVYDTLNLDPNPPATP